MLVLYKNKYTGLLTLSLERKRLFEIICRHFNDFEKKPTIGSTYLIWHGQKSPKYFILSLSIRHSVTLIII